MSGTPQVGVPEGVSQRLAGARLLALDVDGVLTDGRVIYTGEQEAQCFDVKDGAGLAALVRSGLPVVWITGRGCAATSRRADELGARLMTGIQDKSEALAAVQAELGLGPEETVAMGDDLADLAMASLAAVFIAPADAVSEVRARADWVTAGAGGRGAVREVCDALLAARKPRDPASDGARE